MVFFSASTSKLLAWTSIRSVLGISVFCSSLKETFCNLFKRVVFPAFPQPTMMHLTWRTVSCSPPRNFLNVFSLICVDVLSCAFLNKETLSLLSFGSVFFPIKVKYFFFHLLIPCVLLTIRPFEQYADGNK